MSIGNADTAITALDRKFIVDYPGDAARQLESMPETQASRVLARQSIRVILPTWRLLAPNAAANFLTQMPAEFAAELLSELAPNEALQVLGLVDDIKKESLLGLLDQAIARELRDLMIYPPDTAGRLMDTRYTVFRNSLTVEQALSQLRQARVKTTRSLLIIDRDSRLVGRVSIQDLAVADPETVLKDLMQPLLATVDPMAPQSEVAEKLEQFKLTDLPVVNVNGTLMGVVYHSTLIDVAHDSAMADMQAMVGASREERALSPAIFAVRKRMPWLQINLLTAFLAASVVGLFESTIAKYTALAVLLPVVAGQSGNAGAQALAVTMRGLALREITVRSWHSVMSKELVAGLLNGLAIAVTCGLGVYVWSGSAGLVLVIAMSMVLAMVVAGFAGALVPIVLTKLGQDPAQSSSIVLTTVTDVAGFFSFLGIATLLSGML